MAGETGFEKAVFAFRAVLEEPSFKFSEKLFSEILAGVGTVERFVAERKIRDDVVFDASLKQRPLKPTGVAQAASLDPAIAHAKPGQNIAAKSLDDGHAFPGFSQLIRLRPQGGS